ncbi:MAG: hypothetical protein WBW84_19860 [Acidobacteriaceae bacterium]
MTVISPDLWVTEFVNAGLSGNVQVFQGFSSGQSAAGDPLNFFFDTQALYLSSSYDSLDVVAGNLNPLLPGTTHMGAGDYNDGHVYAVIEHWQGCGASSDPIFIAVFNAQTLAAEQSIEISAYIPEASGIAIDYDTGLALVSSFCDAHNLYVFRTSDWRFFGTIPLALPVPGNQGLAYKNGFVYCAGTSGDLYGLRLSDRTMKLLMQAPMPGEYEGIDFHGPQLRWLLNRSSESHVLYSYTPVYSS